MAVIVAVAVIVIVIVNPPVIVIALVIVNDNVDLIDACGQMWRSLAESATNTSTIT